MKLPRYFQYSVSIKLNYYMWFKQRMMEKSMIRNQDIFCKTKNFHGPQKKLNTKINLDLT